MTGSFPKDFRKELARSELFLLDPDPKNPKSRFQIQLTLQSTSVHMLFLPCAPIEILPSLYFILYHLLSAGIGVYISLFL